MVRSSQIRIAPIALALAMLLVGTVSASCSPTSDGEPTVPNLYALARSGIKTGVALPTTPPPQLAWVSLTSADGNQIASFQHSNAMVRVCRVTRGDPCGQHVQLLTRFRFRGSSYRIVFAPLEKLTPGSRFELDDELANYWRSTTFTDKIPTWLTMDLYPGGQFATEDAEQG